MDKIALVSPNSFDFVLKNKFGIASLSYKVKAGVPFLLPRQVGETYMKTDPNFKLYTGPDKPEDVPFVEIQAYVPPPTFIPKTEEQKAPELPAEVKIFLNDLLDPEHPKVHIDMIVPGMGGNPEAASILVDPNIKDEHIKLVAEKLEVPYKEGISREKLTDRIIQVATARLNA